MISQAMKIVDGGKLIVPPRFRRKPGINPRDIVVVELDGDGLHVRSLSGSARLAQSIVRIFAPDDASLADDVTAERRLEAGCE